LEYHESSRIGYAREITGHITIGQGVFLVLWLHVNPEDLRGGVFGSAIAAPDSLDNRRPRRQLGNQKPCGNICSSLDSLGPDSHPVPIQRQILIAFRIFHRSPSTLG
jgi:hypothetical protein